MGNRFICVHGHFYQPPRENPWLDEVEREESARPHHDWNERILQECYGPNLAAPIVDPEGKVLRLLNNYQRISFNFGPTLLAWLERRHPSAYRRLLDADKRSADERGHGNAIAQAYNHVILPLAGERDKRLQIRWGLADFEDRFGRKAEGLWLPETAADDATLEALIEHGVKFTVLAPHQAARWRPLGGGEWSEGAVDTSRAHRWLSRRSPGKHVDLFFYDAELARAVAFERAMADGKAFADQILGRFGEEDRPRLVHYATDGESYGHHHRFGEMGLAFALEWIEKSGGAEVVNYAQFLDRAPADREVELRQPSSWSCAHGVGRWSTDCGCRQHPTWRQPWRGPLRESLSRLAADLDALFAAEAPRLFKDPDAALDAYVRRARAGESRFPEELATRHLSVDDIRSGLRLLESQRQRQLMFTSCGWFFDDVSGLETQQVLLYACRAIELAREAGAELEAPFLETLSQAPSNVPRFKDGATVYRRLAAPRRVDPARAAANAAITELFEEPVGEALVSAFDIKLSDPRRLTGFEKSMLTVHVEVLSRATRGRAAFSCAVVRRARLDVECFLRPAAPEEHAAATRELAAAFAIEDDLRFAQACRRLYPESRDLDVLLVDERSRIVKRLLHPSSDAWAGLRHEWAAEVRKAPPSPGSLDALFALLARAGDAPIERLPRLREAFEALSAVVLEALERGGPEELERAERLTEIALGLPFFPGLWELRLYWGERRAHAALGRRLGFAADGAALEARPS